MLTFCSIDTGGFGEDCADLAASAFSISNLSNPNIDSFSF